MAARFTPHEMLERLIAFPTVSRDSNLELIEFVANYLEAYGVRSSLVASRDGRKANLYATVGPEVEGGVVLSGHTDVVPVDGQNWDSDPFRLHEADGRLMGRGTCDMKGFLAIALALVPDMVALRHPIHLAFSYDEEVGCLGAPDLIRELTANVPRPKAVIVGEPTSMQVVGAHKSMFIFDTVVRGHEVHSSQQHRGVPAVMVAGRLIGWLAERQRRNALDADPESDFVPGYTTLHCGTVRGGTAHNITAAECRFATDIRSLPGEPAESYFRELEEFARQTLEPEMRAVHPDAGIEFEIRAQVPAFQALGDDQAVTLARQLTGQNGMESVPYGAEAGQFQEAGHSVVMCGPGSIDQAHQPNEFITLKQLEAGTGFIRRLIEQLS
ncbi:MAG: acetylornithine deacetylase [Pseudomonadales bacterium]|nr:acetylornithine deacetylase [Pseudomonadales bacterium]NIX06846.1 acetylornithine deacetylase [Pseudomonadales bacterium]